MASYVVPGPDEEFGPAGRKMTAGATGHEVEAGLTPLQVAELNDRLDEWDNAYVAHQAAQTAALSARGAKDTARAAAAALMRAMNTTVQAKADAPEALKLAMGLPVHDHTRTRAAVPTTRPLLVVDASERLRHTLTYRDESTPTSRAKPAGVKDIEVWAKIGAPAPVGPSECQLIDLSSKGSLVVVHKDTDAGKPVHYIGRWRNSRAESGPWSETVIATIGA